MWKLCFSLFISGLAQTIVRAFKFEYNGRKGVVNHLIKFSPAAENHLHLLFISSFTAVMREGETSIFRNSPLGMNKLPRLNEFWCLLPISPAQETHHTHFDEPHVQRLIFSILLTICHCVSIFHSVHGRRVSCTDAYCVTEEQKAKTYFLCTYESVVKSSKSMACVCVR